MTAEQCANRQADHENTSAKLRLQVARLQERLDFLIERRLSLAVRIDMFNDAPWYRRVWIALASSV